MSETAVRTPKQQRSRDSLQRVLDAAMRLLEEQGFEGFTVQQVSGRAGVSVGSIYARFGSKENLLRAAHRAAMEEMSRAHEPLSDESGLASLSDRELVCEAVRRLALPFRRHDRLLRAFMHVGAVDEEIARRGSEGSIDLSGRFEQLLVGRLGRRIRHRDPGLAVDVAYRMAYSTFARRVMYGPTFESERMIEWDELVQEVGRACADYLL